MDTDIDPFLDQVDEAIGDHKFDGHTRMTREELAQPRGLVDLRRSLQPSYCIRWPMGMQG